MKTEKRKSEGNALAFVISMFFAVIAVLLMIILVFQTQKTMKQESSSHLDEVSKQISSSISSQCSDKFNLIDTLCKGMIRLMKDGQLDMDKFSEENSVKWGFDEFCFVDADANIYDKDGIRSFTDNIDVTEKLLKKKNQIILDGNDMLLFIKPVEEFEYNGHIIKAMGIKYGSINVFDILNIEAFGGNANLYIIHENGDVIFRDLNTYGSDNSNLLMSFAEVKFKDGSADELRKNIISNNSKLMVYNYVGEERYISHKNIDVEDWNLIMTVPVNVVSKGIKSFSAMAVTFSVIIGILLLLTGLVLFSAQMSSIIAAKEEAKNSAEKANILKSRFLINMSYEIRTNMNTIMGMTEIAQKQQANSDKTLYCLDKIKVSGNALLRFVNDILEISKIERGELTLCSEEVFLPNIINKCVNEIIPQINVKNQIFSVRVKNVINEYVYSDPLRLYQIFMNFLSNSVKYTSEKGRIAVDIEEVLSEKEDHAHYIITFSDTGSGMTKEFSSRIFDIYENDYTAKDGKTHGSGLGMPFNKKIIQMMGGNVKVESEPERGTVFTADIYLKLADNEVIMSDVFAGMKALIALTDKREREAAAGELRSLGFETDAVSTNDEAADAAMKKAENKEYYDIIILDSPYNGIDPIVAVRMIKNKINYGDTFILIADFDRFDYSTEAAAVGTDGFIKKPLFRSVLYNTLSKYIEKNHKSEYRQRNVSSKQYDFRGKTIMVVEDDAMNREIVSDILRLTGCNVEEAVNGKDALDKYMMSSPGHYNLILMDMQMPVMDGIEATMRIRNSGRSDAEAMPIFAITANAFDKDKAETRTAGMNIHLVKPIDAETMLSQINEYIID